MSYSVKLFPKPANRDALSLDLRALPPVIQTPVGLAMLELQGTINLPQVEDTDDSIPEIPIGRMTFPDYHPETQDSSSTAWMKRVQLFIGQNQRLTGEVKKLPRAIAILRKRQVDSDIAMEDGVSGTAAEDLEVVEIVKYKLMFSHRPEPVGTSRASA
ncbi:Ctf8 [Microdochium nivale]|nr:Ctf8 [Microdochium nivale]